MADRHGSHDLEAIVAYTDGELAGAEFEAVEAQVEDCRECAELVADLRSLALAHRGLVTPSRPRDFRLSPADAERLGRLGPEPFAKAGRLGLDMTGIPAPHASHDPELIAVAVGRDLQGSQRRLVDSWLSDCAPCAELHADLLAIAQAERAMSVPARPRDFRLTPADAHRLRPRGWQAILAAIGSSRDAFSKPLAVGLTTLGLVGLLVGTAPSFGSGTTTILSTVGGAVGAYDNAKSGEPEGALDSNGDGTVFGGQDAEPSAAPSAAVAAPAYGDGGSAAPSAAASAAAAPAASASVAPQPAPTVAAPAANGGTSRNAVGPSVAEATSSDRTAFDTNGSTDQATSLTGEGGGPSALLIASFLMLVAGVALFAAREVARRRRGT